MVGQPDAQIIVAPSEDGIVLPLRYFDAANRDAVTARPEAAGFASEVIARVGRRLARYNVAPDPSGGFAAITAIPKLPGPWGSAARPELAGARQGTLAAAAV